MIMQPDGPPISNGHTNGLKGEHLITEVKPPKRKGNGTSTPTHVWQVRHAGLLGVKYEVAVRYDLVDVDQEGGRDVLKSVVEAALLG